MERARSTTLALLGVTAAVGLAMVALALNQSWPLIAGSAIPMPPGKAEVGKATIVAAVSEHLSTGSGGSEPQSLRTAQGPASDVGGTPSAPPAAGATDFVVSTSTPVSALGGGGTHEAPQSTPKPVAQQPQQAAEAPAAQTTPAPAPAQSTSPSTTPVATETTTPPPTTAEAPEEDGESEEGENGEEEEDDWDGGWHDHGHGGYHGHRWGD